MKIFTIENPSDAFNTIRHILDLVQMNHPEFPWEDIVSEFLKHVVEMPQDWKEIKERTEKRLSDKWGIPVEEL